MLDGEAEGLTRRLIQMAKQGNATALGIVFSRLCPQRRDRTVTIDLPAVNAPADVLTAQASIIAAATRGELSPSEANAMMSMIDLHRRAAETVRFDERLRALEARQTTTSN